jgi:AraC-like DNA-binding protein
MTLAAKIHVPEEKMDKIGGGLLSGIPANALTLFLTRSAIRMQHSSTWSVDKVNEVHDLVVCLEGRGRYHIDGQTVDLRPGDAMLVRAGSRLVGWNPDTATYIGVAQHFTLKLFGHHDLIAQMHLRPMVHLSRWNILGPLVRSYRESAPASSTTLMQFHVFMVVLLEFLEDAFVAWKSDFAADLGVSEGLAVSVMLAATQISADPIDDAVVDRVLAAVPYNSDYFQREFRQRIGWTPRKYREFKRMERAMQLLQAGQSVNDTAFGVGYSDTYYFSRMFKRYIGISPRGYQQEVQRSRDGAFPRGEEDGEVQYPLARLGSLGVAPTPIAGD